MGVIDILTPYDAKKKAAHAAKTVKHGVRISALPSSTSEQPGLPSELDSLATPFLMKAHIKVLSLKMLYGIHYLLFTDQFA